MVGPALACPLVVGPALAWHAHQYYQGRPGLSTAPLQATKLTAHTDTDPLDGAISRKWPQVDPCFAHSTILFYSYS